MDEGDKRSDPVVNWLLVVTMVCIVGLATILIPNFMRARTRSAWNSCINNLRQIDGATQQWVLENNLTTNDIPTWDAVKPYLGRGPEGSLENIYCPDDKTRTCTNSYTLGKLSTLPSCKIKPGAPGHSID